MGSMKRKRRKKQAKLWAEFQAEHELSDETMKLVRATGYPFKILQEKLSDSTFNDDMSVVSRIQAIHLQWQEKLAARRSAINAGLVKRPKKKPKNRHDPAWAQAKKLCRLNTEDICKAKEMGLNPRKLVKNIPSPTQPWKAPVKEWIREMYERKREASRKSPAVNGVPA